MANKVNAIKTYEGRPCKEGHTTRYTSNSNCVVCYRNWQKNNLRTLSVYSARARRNLKKRVMDHYGGVCLCCGESILEFLTIDHINQDGAAHRRSLYGKRDRGAPFYRWLEKNNFPTEFRVLCFNCNFGIFHWGTCPHKVLPVIPS